MSPTGDQPRRRFAPQPIETTFQSIRKGNNNEITRPRVGPNPELTPDASPRSPSPMLLPRDLPPKRRFAPQLIETSRRSRRVGDAGPATRPTDKTDITPYTKHIYATRTPKARRHLEDDDDNEPMRPVPPTRRETEDEAVKEYLLELAAKEAERQIVEDALAHFPNSHAREGGVAHFYFQESSDSDEISGNNTPSNDVPPRGRRKSSNLGLNWWHKHMQEHVQQAHADEDAMDIDNEPTDAELDKMDLTAPPDPLWTTTKKVEAEDRRDSMAHVPTAPVHEPVVSDFAKTVAAKVPDTGVSSSPFGTPFGMATTKPDLKLKAKSPPMLGSDLVFRTCPSPKHTKLETDHPFARKEALPEKHHDKDDGGLWRGYCRSESRDVYIVPTELRPAPEMATPYPAAQTPGGPFAVDTLSSEPSPIGKAGLHALHGLDERLRRAQARAEKNEKIAAELDDEFVTQVYNYLSLGYPALAHDFDDELARISRIDVSELSAEDDKPLSKGYMLQMKMSDPSEGERSPRWRALKVYITEWARQHPDLDSLDPLAWGVRERRGSWGN